MGTNNYRSNEMEEKYRLHRDTSTFKAGCVLCTAPAIKTFTYWKIIPNDFPYDLIASQHDMIIPLRHVTEEDLTAEERAEYLQIKTSEFSDYQFIMEGTHGTKSIPAHLHFHLVACRKGIQ